MAEEYIRELRKQLRDLSAKDQELLIEEISSHMDEAEKDPQIGDDADERREKLMNELGSPRTIANNFKEIYRRGRFVDWLLIVVPYFFYPTLNSLYNALMPNYGWADVRLDIVIHFPLIAIGLWRRSAALTLFWLTVSVFQLLILTTEVYWYYSLQTIFWALLLAAFLGLGGYVLWTSRDDWLIVAFGLAPLSMCVLGSLLSALPPVSYSFGTLGRSLLIFHSSYENIAFFGLFIGMTLFFLVTNRSVRWLALAIYALHLGLGHDYLNHLVPGWVYALWIILPLGIVFLGWWLEQSKRQPLGLAIS